MPVQFNLAVSQNTDGTLTVAGSPHQIKANYTGNAQFGNSNGQLANGQTVVPAISMNVGRVVLTKGSAVLVAAARATRKRITLTSEVALIGPDSLTVLTSGLLLAKWQPINLDFYNGEVWAIAPGPAFPDATVSDKAWVYFLEEFT